MRLSSINMIVYILRRFFRKAFSRREEWFLTDRDAAGAFGGKRTYDIGGKNAARPGRGITRELKWWQF